MADLVSMASLVSTTDLVTRRVLFIAHCSLLVTRRVLFVARLLVTNLLVLIYLPNSGRLVERIQKLL